ncbi:hypothetical protein SISNIDRAFT_397861, partial [Sistotremastrum niveocremeum HHB9708]
LDITTARGIMIGIITHRIPQLFAKRNRRGKQAFTCTPAFVRRYLHAMKWSLRRSTRAAHKFPDNVDEVLTQATQRMAAVVREEEIPDGAFIVNIDQTQVVYAMGPEGTWNQRGVKQVSVSGKDEKRAFTLVVGVSASGDVLPFQVIFAGKTDASCPSSDAPFYDKAMEYGFQIIPSGIPSNYWSNQETMRLLIIDIIVPYFTRQRQRIGDLDQRCILQLDCWSVHRSEEFITWMRKNYPWIILQFVPGGCT